MLSRRDFVRTSTAGLMGLGGIPTLSALQAGALAATPASPSPHFVFLRHSNGTFPSFLPPVNLSNVEQRKEEAKEALDLDLSKYELQEWMAGLDPYKSNLTIVQGLSARMCTMGHETYQSPLAVCKASERAATIKRASVDVELGRLFPTPFTHVELCCTPQEGITKGRSSIGPGAPNYAFGSPKVAMDTLFRAGSDDKAVIAEAELQNKMFTYLSQAIKQKGERLGAVEGHHKLGRYMTSIDAIRERHGKMQAMADQIRKWTPTLSAEAWGDDYTTAQQQEAYADIVVGAMAAGLSNSFTVTLDILGTQISGVMGSTFGLHNVGHGGSVDGVDALGVRERLRMQHVKVIDRIVTGLKKVPEGNGTMFDNTVILYFPENGEAHHSSGSEEPFIILAGNNAKVNFLGRYVRLPPYNTPGHKTLGNFYTTLLNCYGNPIKHYGDLDTSLKIDQEGPIRLFMV